MLAVSLSSLTVITNGEPRALPGRQQKFESRPSLPSTGIRMRASKNIDEPL
jgi:hypothetical protein